MPARGLERKRAGNNILLKILVHNRSPGLKQNKVHSVGQNSQMLQFQDYITDKCLVARPEIFGVVLYQQASSF